MFIFFILQYSFPRMIESYNGETTNIMTVNCGSIARENASSEIKCCSDYQRVGNRCLPCIGMFGVQCARPCPSGWFGFGCRYKCLCPECDATTGQCSDENDRQGRTGEMIGGGVGGLVLLGILVSCIHRRTRKSCQINSTYESTEPEAGETDKTENVYIEMKITKESPSIE
ncbi:uncharacterized protein LOC125679438 [Ostrea edulis]|uniref:uncharacterized protein LOC125679438 n=1 Tax=Ostrea edulis TaxID=37623 RepID=UPI0024AEA21E|nr:uncharacterized protein LOC125679438 [Ostrea edulis]